MTAGELRALGATVHSTAPGRVQFAAASRVLYTAVRGLRTAERVLVEVASFPARRFAELERGVADVDWSPWLDPTARLEVRVTSRGSRLYHTTAVAQRVQQWLAGGAGGPNTRPVGVLVRIDHDQVWLHVDATGEPLSRRGWRLATAKAPLRPTLAAALLLAAGWDGTVPLVDPLCGSGTVAVEAALLARRHPPTVGRAFAVQAWPSFEPGTWAAVTASMAAGTLARAPHAIVAADRDAGAVTAALGNAERAGVAEDVDVRHHALGALDVPDRPAGWLITNPPYGQRVGGGDLRDLYAALGRLVRERLPGWRTGLLVADRALASHTGLVLEERLRFRSGGRPVRFVCTANPSPPAGCGSLGP